MNRPALILAFVILYSFCAKSQGFSGTWQMQSKEHISGPQYGNAIQKQMTVTQNADSFVIATVNVGPGGQDINSRTAIAMDGKPTIIIGKTSKRKFTSSLEWTADKKTLTLTTVFSMPEKEDEVDFTRVETWTLSADGKQLAVDKKSNETRSESWEVKAVFVQ